MLFIWLIMLVTRSPPPIRLDMDVVIVVDVVGGVVMGVRDVDLVDVKLNDCCDDGGDDDKAPCEDR